MGDFCCVGMFLLWEFLGLGFFDGRFCCMGMFLL